MKIAQIAPLFESIPPRLYGGTERVVSYLTEELVKQGHHVTLFASADAITSAELVPCAPCALRLDDATLDPIPHLMLMLDKVREHADDFDVLHFHIDYLHFPLFRSEAARILTTLHGRLDVPDHLPFYLRFSEMRLVSVSNAQQAPLRRANFAGTVHHGLPIDLHKPTFDARGDYLAFLGRLSPEKRPDRAIAIARAVGMPLKIAAKADKVNEGRYFRQVIEPLLREPGVEFIGEIDDEAKTEFLGHAAALVFPVDWPEPFGLVMIEAMACATPVIAFPCGSVPEVIEDGLTGRIVSTMDEAVRAVPQALALDRKAVRRRFEERFSAARMTKDYLRLYRSMIRKAAGRGVDVPALTAASAAATAHVSSGTSHAPVRDHGLVADTVSLGQELCADQV